MARPFVGVPVTPEEIGRRGDAGQCAMAALVAPRAQRHAEARYADCQQHHGARLDFLLLRRRDCVASLSADASGERGMQSCPGWFFCRRLPRSTTSFSDHCSGNNAPPSSLCCYSSSPASAARARRLDDAGESRIRRFPVADDRAIAALVRSAAEHAGPDDIVFVHISTHGSSHWLASQFGRGPPRMITGAQLARQFAPLDRQASVIIIISACYSGSLIPSLQAPRRIIITAARADRNSFGCSPSRRHTYFGEAELHAFAESGHSLQQIEDLRDTVASMERQKRLTSSEPQVSVGSDVSKLYVMKAF